jgi:hypothetical protein
MSNGLTDYGLRLTVRSEVRVWLLPTSNCDWKLAPEARWQRRRGQQVRGQVAVLYLTSVAPRAPVRLARQSPSDKNAGAADATLSLRRALSSPGIPEDRLEAASSTAR